MPFTFQRLRIPEVVLVQSGVAADERGHFIEVFRASEFAAAGISSEFSQVNRSFSSKNVLRGLHFQLKPRAQAKLVGVVRGEIFNVAVDIRKGSPTFGQWVAERLSGGQGKMLYIPEGFAHGFYALTDVDVIYSCSREYAPELERCVLWNDPRIGVVWPVTAPVLSSRDTGAKTLDVVENNFGG
jgi:dTDP-4-dehydrorhamnose 3,5-epimerase